MSCHGATWEEFVHHGQTVTVVSSNVTAARYDWMADELTVQYGADGGTPAAYTYSGVSWNEAFHFFYADSTGSWVWDHLRVRGSKTAHRKPFRAAPLLVAA